MKAFREPMQMIRSADEAKNCRLAAGRRLNWRKCWTGLPASRDESEIQQLDALSGDENVGRFQVAMRDAFLMRGVERIQDLPSVFHRNFSCARIAS